MKDRKALQDELNRINSLYQEKDLEMRKINASDADRQRMRDMLNAKKERLMAEYGDDLQKLNAGDKMVIPGGTTSGLELDQKKLPDMAEQKNLGKEGMFKRLGSKLGGRTLKALPIIGSAVGLASAGQAAYAGDYDTAKEELASAVDPTGITDVALLARDIANAKQDVTNRNAIKKGEIIGDRNYKMSPAFRDRRGMEESEQDIEDINAAKQEALRKIRGY